MRIQAMPAVLLFLVLVGQQFETARSECCTGHPISAYDLMRSVCHDGTNPEPCCGQGQCNLLCCNCRGGCRSKREVTDEDYSQGGSEENDDPISKHDLDGDGKISVPEARRWLMAGGCGNPIDKVMDLSSEFGRLDSDKDGLLDRDEIGG